MKILQLKLYLAELKTCVRLNGAENFFTHCLSVSEFWEEEEIGASGGGGKMAVSFHGVDRERRVELLEAKQRRTTAAGDKLEQQLLLDLCELSHQVPKQDNRLMSCIVVGYTNKSISVIINKLLTKEINRQKQTYNINRIKN